MDDQAARKNWAGESTGELNCSLGKPTTDNRHSVVHGEQLVVRAGRLIVCELYTTLQWS